VRGDDPTSLVEAAALAAALVALRNAKATPKLQET
jgi:hypothetical protein